MRTVTWLSRAKVNNPPEEYVEAVEMLLQWEEQNHVEGQPYSWESVDRSSSSFTQDITPLILAVSRVSFVGLLMTHQPFRLAGSQEQLRNPKNSTGSRRLPAHAA
jgi:hypothetical protein